MTPEAEAKIDSHKIQQLIITKVKNLIEHKNLEFGDKLPSERVMSENFNVSRRNVREAIKKLELNDLVISIPQSGTFIANIGRIALIGIMEDLLNIKDQDFKSLIETRELLELQIVGLAAERRSEEELELIEDKFNNYKTKFLNGEDAFQEDLLFHLSIARACGNSTLNTLMLQITPKLIKAYQNNRVCNKGEFMIDINKFIDLKELRRHQDIYEAIKDKNAPLAIEKMKIHFEMITQL
ncbi:FadR/GntR family transcriptional regulator [Flavobacterium muglaense]|uniref:FadR family transcriptional regulator n=1 Tax=Flavobacterium muglaense TaxID=2764716 RepID=A0A923MXN2_9FLAO|nr:FCD domain-containing protein [Flavobacterium muglaense]MBC5836444.1 FadR family transcriptional regulator [Flavobacterium muglaense]MBC5842974.1 FadR family transcriptional regulator [Flavobacterium muglaense]